VAAGAISEGTVTKAMQARASAMGNPERCTHVRRKHGCSWMSQDEQTLLMDTQVLLHSFQKCASPQSQNQSPATVNEFPKHSSLQRKLTPPNV
jgi:hypothetical protein